jgi:hypothetical protein
MLAEMEEVTQGFPPIWRCGRCGAVVRMALDNSITVMSGVAANYRMEDVVGSAVYEPRSAAHVEHFAPGEFESKMRKRMQAERGAMGGSSPPAFGNRRPSDPPLHVTGVAEGLVVRPGDTVIFKVDSDSVTANEIAMLQQKVGEVLPYGSKFMVISGQFEMTVIRKD